MEENLVVLVWTLAGFGLIMVICLRNQCKRTEFFQSRNKHLTERLERYECVYEDDGGGDDRVDGPAA